MDISFDAVVHELRNRDFGVLSTVSDDERPHSAGVNYGVSRPGRPLAIYVMTRRHLKKARNIARNPQVALLVPLTRRLLWFLPPPSVSIEGLAEILAWDDAAGTLVFDSFFLGRQILKRYRSAHIRGETRICFVRIIPDGEISTYMVGYPMWEMSKRMESGAAKVRVPAGDQL